jgi:uncharacterized membrane protein
MAALPMAAAACAFGLILWTLLRRAAALQVSAYDAAFFEQVVWNLGHGRGFSSGYFGASFLGLHFSPLLVLPAGLELVWPDTRLLAVLHATALALSAPAAYLFLRALFGERQGAGLAAAALAAPLPFWAAVQDAAVAGFHPEALALPLVLIAGWAGLGGRGVVCWACALLALCAREDQAYAVLVIGCLLAVHGPSRPMGLALAALAAVWGITVELVVMPSLRGPARSDLASYYTWLHGAAPGELAAALAPSAGWLAFAGMVASMAGLPLLRAGWLALGLPPLAADLLSAHEPQPQLQLQYGLPLVVPVLVAGGLGARRLLRHPRPAVVLAALALPALVVGGAFGSLAAQRQPAGRPALHQLLVCAAALPASAPLAADDGVAAPLAARPVERPLSWARPGDWVLVDRTGGLSDYVDHRGRAQLLRALPRSGRPLFCDDGRFQLWGPAGRQVGVAR